MSESTGKLSEEELYECLKSLNVPVRFKDLKQPTKDFILTVLECFLKDLHVDILNQLPSWESIQHIEYPEISEDARKLALLIISVNIFTRQHGLIIRLKDVTDPKPKRTKKILNYLIVFWNYCLVKYAFAESIQEGFQEEMEAIDSVIKENESLEQQYNAAVLALNDMGPIEELNQWVALNHTKLNECIKQKEAIAVEYRDLKTKEQDLRSQILTAEANIISAKESVSELDQCILSSPEQFTDDISKLKDLIRNEEFKIKEKDSELKEKMKMLEDLKLTQEENSKAVKLLQKTMDSYAELSDAASAFVQKTQETKHQEEEIEKLSEELNRKKDFQYLCETKSVQAHMLNYKQNETFKDTFLTLQKDLQKEQELLAVSKSSTHDLVQRIEKGADEVLEVVALCKQAEVESEKALSAYRAQMDAISTLHSQHCNEIKNKVKLLFEF